MDILIELLRIIFSYITKLGSINPDTIQNFIATELKWSIIDDMVKLVSQLFCLDKLRTSFYKFDCRIEDAHQF